MSDNRIAGTVRRVYEEVFNGGDLEVVEEVIAPWAVDHAPRSLSSLPIQAIEDFLVELCTAFPDVYWTVEEIQAHGDTVIVRTTVSGSHHAEFRGLRPMGGQFTIAVEDRVRVSAGKIVGHWGELDMVSLRRQLVVPFGGPARQERI